MATNPHEAAARCTEAWVAAWTWGSLRDYRILTIEFSSHRQGGEQEPLLEGRQLSLYFTCITSGVSVYKDFLGCIRKFINFYIVNAFQRNIYKATQNNTVSRKQPLGAPQKPYWRSRAHDSKNLRSPSRPLPSAEKPRFTYKFLYFT